MLAKKFIYGAAGVLNAVFSLSMRGRGRRRFYSADEICPRLRELEAAYDEIRAEYINMVHRIGAAPLYHDLDKFQTRISAAADHRQAWRMFVFASMGNKSDIGRKMCPRTAYLIDRLPGVVQAAFSTLEGAKSVPAHRSPYWGYLRYHLAIVVPRISPPSLRVENEWVQWQEGVGFIFDDALEHEVVNRSEEVRAILIIDLCRPMGRLGNVLNQFTLLLLRHTYGRLLVRRLDANYGM